MFQAHLQQKQNYYVPICTHMGGVHLFLVFYVHMIFTVLENSIEVHNMFPFYKYDK